MAVSLILSRVNQFFLFMSLTNLCNQGLVYTAALMPRLTNALSAAKVSFRIRQKIQCRT